MERGVQTLAYFYVNQNKSAKHHIFSKIKLLTEEFLPEKEGDSRLICCEVPAYYRGKCEWDMQRLRDILEQELDQIGADSWYLGPLLCQMAGFSNKLPDVFLLKKLFRLNSCWENIVFIGCDSREDGLGEDGLFERMSKIEREQELFVEVIQEYLPRINKFTIITNQIQAYEELAEGLYDEYGLITDYRLSLGEWAAQPKKILILDFRAGYRPLYEGIPKNAIYIDIWSEYEKEESLSRNRQDISYLSVVRWLDTLLKNRYNTLVN